LHVGVFLNEVTMAICNQQSLLHGGQISSERILGDYLGATSLERFIDANNTSIPDYAAKTATAPRTFQFLTTEFTFNPRASPRKFA
jgi:hypothetical protein